MCVHKVGRDAENAGKAANVHELARHAGAETLLEPVSDQVSETLEVCGVHPLRAHPFGSSVAANSRTIRSTSACSFPDVGSGAATRRCERLETAPGK